MYNPYTHLELFRFRDLSCCDCCRALGGSVALSVDVVPLVVAVADELYEVVSLAVKAAAVSLSYSSRIVSILRHQSSSPSPSSALRSSPPSRPVGRPSCPARVGETRDEGGRMFMNTPVTPSSRLRARTASTKVSIWVLPKVVIAVVGTAVSGRASHSTDEAVILMCRGCCPSCPSCPSCCGCPSRPCCCGDDGGDDGDGPV